MELESKAKATFEARRGRNCDVQAKPFQLVFLAAALSPQRLFATMRARESYNRGASITASSPRASSTIFCVSKRTSKTLDPSFDRSQFGEPFELGMEIFRRGPAWRMDAIRGGDFADATAPAETRIFDGRAGILSQRQAGSSRFFQIYPAESRPRNGARKSRAVCRSARQHAGDFGPLPARPRGH